MTVSGYLTRAEADAREAQGFAGMFGLSVEDREELAAFDDAALAAEVARVVAEVDQFRACAAFAADGDRRRLVQRAFAEVRSMPLAPPSTVRTPEQAVEHLLRAAAAWTAARFQRGEARSLPHLPPTDPGGRSTAIWV